MKKSFQRVIATLNLFQGKQSLTIFMLAAIFALSACDDSSSAGGDDGETSALSSSAKVTEPAEVTDGSSDSNGEAISSSGKSNDPAEATDKSSDSKDNPSSAGTSTKSSNSNTSGNDAKSSSSAGKEVSSSSEEMKTAWDYLNPDIDYGEFTDERDGQVYKTVKIGDQIWMAQNLNYAYTGIKFNFSGGKSDSTSWCYKNNLDNCGVYGRLYTWSAAMDSAGLVSDANKIGCGFGVPCIPNNPHRGICPVGWHLPDTTELTVLLNYAGGGIVAQNVLKSKSGWNGTDDLGFSLLPAGTGVYSYLFDHLKQYTEIWSVAEADGDHDERAWILKIDYSDLQRSLFNNKKSYHLSVRCIKDSD